MNITRAVVLLLFCATTANAAAPTSPALTRWGRNVEPSSVWPEYPRPGLVRSIWQNLNGRWQYAVVSAARTAPAAQVPSHFDGTILVPFPFGSALSGVRGSVKGGEHLWYQRSFSLAPDETGARILLHFESVDAPANILLNGHSLGIRAEGPQRFTVDATQAMLKGTNTLSVDVRASHNETHGLTQSVWLEAVPSSYVRQLTLTPDADRGLVSLETAIAGNDAGLTAYAVISGASPSAVGATAAEGAVNGRTTLRIKQPHLWSPEDPYLYQVDVAVMRGGEIIDQVHSYFGLRKVESHPDEQGRRHVTLNGRALFNLGVRETGQWPDGLETAPTDAALRFDVEAAKAAGFNLIHKLGPPASDRWYFYCDKLGILVWQDIGRAEDIAQRAAHPSIIAWVAAPDLAAAVRKVDPTRLLGTVPGLLSGAAVLDRSVETQDYAARIGELKKDQLAGVAGAITAQLTDEETRRGLLSFDRASAHLPLAQIASGNRSVVPQAPHDYAALRDVR